MAESVKVSLSTHHTSTLKEDCLSVWQVKDKVKKLDSYIEDTPDLLRQFLEINEKDDIPEDTIPISIDIKSMYSNIPLKKVYLLSENVWKKERMN